MDDIAALVASARSGDRRSLARLISRVENRSDGGPEALAALYPDGGAAFVTGITGAPGSGKSTLVDHFVDAARKAGSVAVVAVDPSSPFTGGAILGDRVRMQRHVSEQDVYIRSMANRGHLGGIAVATPAVVAVLDGVGFPEIVVETVGVGQAEVAVAGASDTVVVVLTPGWGDGIQAAKAGLLEVADVFVVNKADRPGADETVAEIERMLDLGPQVGWRPPVVATSALDGTGIDLAWDAVTRHREHLVSTGEMESRRADRAAAEVEAAISEVLRTAASAAHTGSVAPVLARVVARDIDPWHAAETIVGGR